MNIIICKDYAAVSAAGADIIEKIVREKPDCTLGLATGSSPVGMYRELARRCREEGLDFSRVHSVNLDEYVGLEPTHDQSYRYFMDDNLFNHINIDKRNTYVAKGVGDVDANLAEFNAILDKTDIDVQVLGDKDLWAAAALGENDAAVMVANDSDRTIPLACDFQGRTVAACRITDAGRTDHRVPFPDAMPPRSFAIVLLNEGR